MLDQFLEVLEKNAAAKTQEDELTELFNQLPVDEVAKIASLGKAACGPDNGTDNWLAKYEGSPLYQEAIALEKELLEIEASDIEARMQRPERENTWEKKDMVRLKKRMLDLKLSTGENAEEQVEEQQEAAEDPAEAAEQETLEAVAEEPEVEEEKAAEYTPEEQRAIDKATVGGGMGGFLMGPLGAGIGSKVSGGGFVRPLGYSIGGGVAGGLAGGVLGGDLGRHMGATVGSAAGGIVGARSKAKSNVQKARKKSSDGAKEASAPFDMAGRAFAHAMNKVAAKTQLKEDPEAELDEVEGTPPETPEISRFTRAVYGIGEGEDPNMGQFLGGVGGVLSAAPLSVRAGEALGRSNLPFGAKVPAAILGGAALGTGATALGARAGNALHGALTKKRGE